MKSSACNFADRPWPKKLFRPSCSGKPRFITSYPKQLRKYFYTMCNFKFYLSLLKSFNRLNRIPTSTTDTYNRLNHSHDTCRSTSWWHFLCCKYVINAALDLITDLDSEAPACPKTPREKRSPWRFSDVFFLF